MLPSNISLTTCTNQIICESFWHGVLLFSRLHIYFLARDSIGRYVCMAYTIYVMFY